MLVSVIIPTMNEEKALPYLLDSLKKQAGFEGSGLEIIVADACSIDRTKKIARDYGCMVVDGGIPAVSRNNGAVMANGDIFLFKDADSHLPHSNFLYQAVQEFNERRLDVATPLYYALHNKNGFAGRRYEWYINHFANPAVEKSGNTNNPLMMNFMLARRQVHNTIEGFDETLEFGEDANYAKRAKEAGFKFGVLRNCGKIGFNMRKAEGNFLKELRWVFLNVYFNIGRAFGHEFRINESKIRYW